ncbi:uncharacterized protein PRCAT00004803001 [Priceomyces carsonii]|uniref:uncharacterized protein n=1 Tax=Priceomyces carsonii TaxID=28549 RepID=UPI002ED88179|nr:unnamed protein product [Priceomyces carsonii]
MRRWFTTSSLKNSNTFELVVSRLCVKIDEIQKGNPKYLITATDSLIVKHQETLVGHFNIDATLNDTKKAQCIWNHLVSYNDMDLEVQKLREKILKEREAAPPDNLYHNFLKALYPLRSKSALQLRAAHKNYDLFENDVKYSLVNHKLLYKRYCELQNPYHFNIKPDHLEDFLERFLKKRDFVKPSALSLMSKMAPKTTVTSFNQMLNIRSDYVKMCSKIFEDMRRFGLPLTPTEQRKLIFFSFFKDRNEIVKKTKLAMEQLSDADGNHIKLLGYSRFNFEAYNLIIGLFDSRALDINMFNTLLLHSISHEQWQVFVDIIEKIGLDHIINDGPLNEKSLANGRTYEILIDLFSSEKNMESLKISKVFALTRIIDSFVNSAVPIEIGLINKIASALISYGRIELTEHLYSKIFSNPVDPEVNEVLTYKGLTVEDKAIYKKYTRAYEKLKNIINECESYKLLPNEETFTILISFYCSGHSDEKSFRKICNLIYIMEEKYDLPITTRIFKIIFDKFIQARYSGSSNIWSLDGLISITAKLVECHEKLDNISCEVQFTDQLNNLELSEPWKDFLQAFLKERRASNVPIHKGNFLKLHDDLVNKVFLAFVNVAKQEPDIDEEDRFKLLQSMQKLYSDLLHQLQDIRGINARFYDNEPNLKNISQIDEVNYVKKLFLLDIIDVSLEN